MTRKPYLPPEKLHIHIKAWIGNKEAMDTVSNPAIRRCGPAIRSSLAMHRPRTDSSQTMHPSIYSSCRIASLWHLFPCLPIPPRYSTANALISVFQKWFFPITLPISTLPPRVPISGTLSASIILTPPQNCTCRLDDLERANMCLHIMSEKVKYRAT